MLIYQTFCNKCAGNSLMERRNAPLNITFVSTMSGVFNLLNIYTSCVFEARISVLILHLPVYIFLHQHLRDCFQAKTAKEKGITMMAIGIGDNIYQKELDEIASTSNLVSVINDFGSLNNNVNTMVKLICTCK